MSKRTRDDITHIENRIADHQRKRAAIMRMRDALQIEHRAFTRPRATQDERPSTWGNVFTRLARGSEATN